MSLGELFLENLPPFISSYGLWAVFILMTLESALIPIPTEITMPLAGFLAGKGILSLWQVILVGSVGNLAGALIIYKISYDRGEDWVNYLIKKWGKYLLINSRDFEKSKKWYEHYGPGITFGARLIPLVRAFITLPAGVAKMNVFLFAGLTFLGSLIWSGLLALVGFLAGENWAVFYSYFRESRYLIIFLITLLVIVAFESHRRRRSKS